MSDTPCIVAIVTAAERVASAILVDRLDLDEKHVRLRALIVAESARVGITDPLDLPCVARAANLIVGLTKIHLAGGGETEANAFVERMALPYTGGCLQ